LLLVTAVPPMVLAYGGMPPLYLIAAVVVGGAFAAGGANTINCWIERDRDQLMRRTHGRPLPRGEIVPTRALVFGIVLNLLAVAGIPMLPVVRGIEATTQQIAGYAMVTVALTFALTLTGDVGRVYAGAVLVLGALFVARALSLMRQPTPQRAIRFFAWSNVYL